MTGPQLEAARPAPTVATQPAAAAEEQAVAEAVPASEAATRAATRPWALQATTSAPGAPPPEPGPGTVYGRSRPPEPGAGTTGDGPRPLRVGWHTASRPALARLGWPARGSGLVLGVDADHHPVPVRLLRPEPTQVTVVGTGPAAPLVVVRALALGGAVAVLTTVPEAWRGLGERATGAADRVVVLEGDQPVHPFGTAAQPVLLVYDLDDRGPAAPPEPGAWQTRLTVLRRLGEPGVPPVRDGDLLVAQRLQPDEAELLTRVRRLDDRTADDLAALPDGMLAVFDGTARAYVWTSPTPVEQELLGLGSA
jgi:hypothetical protein